MWSYHWNEFGVPLGNSNCNVSASKSEFYARIRIGLHDFQNAHAHTDKFNWDFGQIYTGQNLEDLQASLKMIVGL